MFKFTLFIALGTLIYIFLAPAFYQFLFPQYTESILYSQIFSISLIAIVATLPNTVLQVKVAKKQLYQLNICKSFVQIGLLFLFVHLYGLLGIILARVISRFISLAITCWLVKKI